MNELKVILIDDESIIRQGIRDSIPWSELGYEFCGEAPNGKIGLQLMEQIKPDLAIVDIRMPVMDGLEMAEIACEKYPDTALIILSGFDDFQYARRAMRAKVLDYVLKPIFKPDFASLLERARDQIQERKEENLRHMTNELRVQEAEPILFDQRLRQWLAGASDMLDEEAIVEEIQSTIGFSIERLALVFKEKVSQELLEPHHQQEDPVQMALQNLISDDGYVLRMHEQGLAILWSKISCECAKNAWQGWQDQGFHVSVGLSSPIKELSDLPQAYSQAQRALDDRFYEGKHSFIPFETVESQKERGKYPKDLELRLADFVCKGPSEMIDSEVDRFFEEICEDGPLTQQAFRRLVLRLLVNVEKKVLADSNQDTHRDIHEDFPLDDFLAMETLPEMRQCLLSCLHHLCSHALGKEQETLSAMVRKAIDIIREDYATASLTQIAERLSLTPNYLSLLFKQETGKKFIEYLTDIRVSKAKDLLLKTEMKNYQIADAVGYPNARYFSQIFKKHTGKTPSEYRNFN